MAKATPAPSQLDALVQRVEALVGRTTELVETTRGLALNHMLHSGTRAIPAGGVLEMATTVPMASVIIGAHAAAGVVTAVASPPEDPAPIEGIGVLVVPPGIFLCVPLTGNVLTVYGTPGDQVYIGISSRLLPPSGS